MSDILIRGGHVIDPAQKIDADMDVLVRDGRIASVGAPGTLGNAADVINAKGLIVAPGFIDLHVHLREPGQTHKETIATGTAAAAAGGFTSVCAMPNTSPVNDTAEATAWMQKAERGAVVNVLPIAAATIGSLGEQLTDFRALQKAGAVAVSDDGKPILNDDVMRKALALAKELGIPVVQHAEDTAMTAGRPMNFGRNAFRMGMRGQPAEAESRIVERDIKLARETGARLHIAHISTAASLTAIRQAKRDGVNVSCEVTPHHFLFTDGDIGDYDTNFKMNPPLRSAEDRDAMIEGLLDGTIDAIATDHAPHAVYEKNVEFDRAMNGITGLEVALGLAITHLHRARKTPVMRIVELMSANPARIVGCDGRGSLSNGAHADITIFDPKKRWVYDVERSRSLSRNCPYSGMQLYGRVAYTIVGGKVVYKG